MRALCLHGHFYQPPREHPWLGVVEPEVSAAPARDWNTRITTECYAPNAAARVLDAHGRLSRTGGEELVLEPVEAVARGPGDQHQKDEDEHQSTTAGATSGVR